MWKRDMVIRWHRGQYLPFHRATCTVCNSVGMVARAVNWEQWERNSCYYCRKKETDQTA